MIRLLFLPVFVLMIFSCESTSNNAEMVYQISAADSVRCMEEILEGILTDSIGTRKIEKEIYNFEIPFCGVIEVLRITMNSRGDLMIDKKLDSADVREEVYEFFMCNRNLTLEETNQFAVNPDYEGFDKPFYNRFSLDEIDQRIERNRKNLGNIKDLGETEMVSQELMYYYESELQEWKDKKRALDLIGTQFLPQISSSAHVRFSYQKESNRAREVLKEIAFAFYRMRNDECLRYFNETYLTLYDRSQRFGNRKDQEKLKALEILHPAPICQDDWSAPRKYGIPEPPLESTP